MNTNTNHDENEQINQAMFGWLMDPEADSLTMPSGWDLSEVLAEQEQQSREQEELRLKKPDNRRHVPLNPVREGDEHFGFFSNYHREALSGPNTYPSLWHLS